MDPINRADGVEYFSTVIILPEWLLIFNSAIITNTNVILVLSQSHSLQELLSHIL